MADRNLIDQLKKVFRLKTGDKIIVFNGDGKDYECLIKELVKDKVALEVQNSFPAALCQIRKYGYARL